MKNIEKVDLGNNEIINVKKGMFGYRIVYPHKDINGKIVWVNLLVGGWGNFWKLLFIMVVILSFLYGVREMTASCRDMAEHPENYFECETPIQNDLRLNFKVGDFNEET